MFVIGLLPTFFVREWLFELWLSEEVQNVVECLPGFTRCVCNAFKLYESLLRNNNNNKQPPRTNPEKCARRYAPCLIVEEASILLRRGKGQPEGKFLHVPTTVPFVISSPSPPPHTREAKGVHRRMYCVCVSFGVTTALMHNESIFCPLSLRV